MNSGTVGIGKIDYELNHNKFSLARQIDINSVSFQQLHAHKPALKAISPFKAQLISLVLGLVHWRRPAHF